MALALRVVVSLILFHRRPGELFRFTISSARVPQNAPQKPPILRTLFGVGILGPGVVLLTDVITVLLYLVESVPAFGNSEMHVTKTADSVNA